jgi:hypothetical protein
MKQGHALPPLLFNHASEYANTKVQENEKGLELSGKHHLLLNTYDNLLGEMPLRKIQKFYYILIRNR